MLDRLHKFAQEARSWADLRLDEAVHDPRGNDLCRRRTARLHDVKVVLRGARGRLVVIVALQQQRRWVRGPRDAAVVIDVLGPVVRAAAEPQWVLGHRRVARAEVGRQRRKQLFVCSRVNTC